MPPPSPFSIIRDGDEEFAVRYGNLKAVFYLQRTHTTRDDDEYYTLERPFTADATMTVMDDNNNYDGRPVPVTMQKMLDTDKLLCWTIRTLVARGKLSPSGLVQFEAETHDEMRDYERRGFTLVSRNRDIDEAFENPGGLMTAKLSDILDFCRRWWLRVIPRRNATITQQGGGTYSDLVGAAMRQGRDTFVYRGNLYKRTRHFFRKVGPAFE